MICPFCQNDTLVYNSRLTGQKQQVWRRRRCVACRKTFTTKERTDWTGVVTVVTQRSHSPYSRERLQLSIAKACFPLLEQHGSVGMLCDTIEQKLLASGFFTHSPQEASLITHTSIEVLRAYNPSFAISYVQQVYRQNPPLELLRELLDDKRTRD